MQSPLDFNLIQITPMFEDDSNQEGTALTASFSDPYVLILRDDFSVMLLHCDDNGDIDEPEKSEVLAGSKWKAGCLYKDHSQSIARQEKPSTLLFLVDQTGSLQVPITDANHV
jgi:cleavage and polyadenylation specificity factor subunit 1